MEVIPFDHRNMTKYNLSKFEYIFYLSHSFSAPLPSSMLAEVLEEQIHSARFGKKTSAFLNNNVVPTVEELTFGFSNQKKSKLIKDLDSLRIDYGVYISNTDKNLGLVALPLDYDVRHCEIILNNGLFSPITHEEKDRFLDRIIPDIHTVLFEHNNYGTISRKSLDFSLTKLRDRHIPKVKPLPKIHKNRNDWNDPPARPVIGASNAYNKGPSKIIHSLLFPALKGVVDQNGRSPLCMSSFTLVDALQALKFDDSNIIPDGVFGHGIAVITGDFDALYNHISLDEAKKGVRFLYDTFGPGYFTYRSYDCVMDLLPFIFHTIVRNRHDDSYHEASNLLAMGTDSAPSIAYASLVPLDMEMSKYSSKIMFYCRYIDDVFIILRGIKNLQEIYDLLNELNALVPTHHKINWGTRFDADNFLDMMIGYNRYTKSIDTNIVRKFDCLPLYLHPDSMHPHNMLRGIIIGQIFRAASLVATQQFFREQLVYIYKAGVSIDFPAAAFKELGLIMKHDISKNAVLNCFSEYKQINGNNKKDFRNCAVFVYDKYNISFLRQVLKDEVALVHKVNSHVFP